MLGFNDYLYRAFRPAIEFLRPVPSVALIPLAILIYGTGLQSKVFLVAFACVWPLLIQTIYGARDLDPIAAGDRPLVPHQPQGPRPARHADGRGPLHRHRACGSRPRPR